MVSAKEMEILVFDLFLGEPQSKLLAPNSIVSSEMALYAFTQSSVSLRDPDMLSWASIGDRLE